MGFEILNDKKILLGSENKFYQVDVEKNRAERTKLGGAIIKIKKFSESLAACISSKRIEIVDLRVNTSVQEFPQNNVDIKSLEVLPPHTLVFGSDRTIGIVDDRRASSILWKNQMIHRGMVTDIIRLNEYVISGDNAGKIYGWKFENM